MNRRSFFSKALGVAAAMVAGPEVVKAVPATVNRFQVIHSSKDEYRIAGTFPTTKVETSIQDVLRDNLPDGMKWINWHAIEMIGDNSFCKWEATAWSVSKWEAVKNAVDAQRGLRWNRRYLDISKNLSSTP